MHIISRDSPCYYLTSVAKDRLPVFRSDEIKLITCAAVDEARKSGKFALYAYVIMPDHLHVITDAILSPSKTLQFINGITGRRLRRSRGKRSLRTKQNHQIAPLTLVARF